MDLTINPTYFVSDTASTCDNTPYLWTGHSNITIPTVAGTYTLIDTLTTEKGCDSICFLSLTIHPTYITQEVVEACQSKDEKFIWQGKQIDLYEAKDVQRDEYFKTVNGCDSIHKLTLILYGRRTILRNKQIADNSRWYKSIL